MRDRRYWWYVAGLVPLAGLASVHGCLATLERNLDYLLAPDALENTLFLPFSTIAPWALLFVSHVI
jgi:hypothetical protein